MMDAPAVRVAIDLVHVPSRVRLVRREPLPEGVLTVLQIAAGDEAAEIEAADAVGRPRELVRSAAAFFIEQILLGPNSDSYRVLGADRNATAAELRRNMALLLRWLHPDVDRKGLRSMFAGRVTQAWGTLKTPDRRAAYDKESAARAAALFRKRAQETAQRRPRPRFRRVAGSAAGAFAARHVAAARWGAALSRRGTTSAGQEGAIVHLEIGPGLH
jgi:hypothetical protein